MVATEKYRDTYKTFLETVENGDREVRVSEGTVYIYEDGAWAVASPRMLDELDRSQFEACEDHNFPYGEKYSPLWRHIKGKLPRIDSRELDAGGLIALRNGTLDPRTGSLSTHDPEHFTTRRADVAYDPKAKCPEWLKMLGRVFEDKPEADAKEHIDFLQQWFGLALVGLRHYGRPFRKALILDGPEGTGKSTIADVLKLLIGEADVATEDVDQLSGRFGLANVVKSRALIADDAAGANSKVHANVLKKLITGESMTADRKMREAVSFSFHGPVMLTTNNMPKIDDSTHALYGRTMPMKLTRQFSKKDATRDLDGMKPIPWLQQHKEFPGILNWSLKGLSKVVELGGLPDVRQGSLAQGEWRAQNDPLFSFLREFCEYDETVCNFVTPIAAAVSVYANAQMGKSLKPHGVATLLGRDVANVVPGVKNDRRYNEKKQIRCLTGLRLNEDGKEWVQEAYKQGALLASKKWPINEKLV